ncbi:hypothetical protein PHMEG_00021409 [Phytophthora megakarya]|uniref:Uncharacterized protein n=1 Tax=Phytophthora megakarya TaxID=4795 RepID=A0A225VLD5_9STRA|nr:hypothetical protein PHMEG_00021409 [Phytophthora megakarya]
MLPRIKKALGDSTILAKQAALASHQEFQVDMLCIMLQARRVISDFFKMRFSGMNFALIWITFLDPRFHKMKLLQRDEIDLGRHCLLDAAAIAARNSLGQPLTPDRGSSSIPGNIVTAKRCQMDVIFVRDLAFIAEAYAGPKER